MAPLNCAFKKYSTFVNSKKTLNIRHDFLDMTHDKAIIYYNCWYYVKTIFTSKGLNYSVRWIRIDWMRIHKIWLMRIQINKIAKLILNYHLKVKWKKIFSNLYLNLRNYLLLRFRVEKLISNEKKTPKSVSYTLLFP